MEESRKIKPEIPKEYGEIEITDEIEDETIL